MSLLFARSVKQYFIRLFLLLFSRTRYYMITYTFNGLEHATAGRPVLLKIITYILVRVIYTPADPK